MKEEILALLDHLYTEQERRLISLGTTIVPGLTKEDLLQPMDYDELEENPSFRFEEGVLNGIGETRAALYSFFSDLEDSFCVESSSDTSLCKD